MAPVKAFETAYGRRICMLRVDEEASDQLALFLSASPRLCHGAEPLEIGDGSLCERE
jgi:hypothetical protein